MSTNRPVYSLKTMYLTKLVKEWLEGIQFKLEFRDWNDRPQFAKKMGLGRVAIISVLLGMIWGIHITLFIFLTMDTFQLHAVFPKGDCFLGNADRVRMLWQWSFYVVGLCTFHLLEFFTTAGWNPTVVSADSFLINHSITYTAAALFSWTEFFLRFCLGPSWNSILLTVVGMAVAVLSQMIRSLAMTTCGESFNHVIQHSKKNNHVLVTRGIYKYFRHPSYVGFFYWSIGMQCILNNYLSILCFTVASWNFFARRIPYEEECLVELFPTSYPAYVQRTWIGIPFLQSHIGPDEHHEVEHKRQ